MPTLIINKTYADGDILFEADLDAISDSIETFLNTTKIDDDNIQDGGIDASVKLTAASITEDRIASSAITTSKIADSNVTTAKIADSNVTTAKIADSNVTTAKIADSNVTTAKIADSNVTTAKMANGAITHPKLAQMHTTSSGQSGTLTIFGNTANADLAGTDVTADFGSGRLAEVGFTQYNTGASSHISVDTVSTGGLLTIQIYSATDASVLCTHAIDWTQLSRLPLTAISNKFSLTGTHTIRARFVNTASSASGQITLRNFYLTLNFI